MDDRKSTGPRRRTAKVFRADATRLLAGLVLSLAVHAAFVWGMLEIRQSNTASPGVTAPNHPIALDIFGKPAADASPRETGTIEPPRPLRTVRHRHPT